MRKLLNLISVDHSRRCCALTPFTPPPWLGPAQRGKMSERTCVLLILSSKHAKWVKEIFYFKLVSLYLHWQGGTKRYELIRRKY